MVFKRRTVKNTRKFKPNSKTSIKTSTINKRSVGNNRTVKVSQTNQGGSQQNKTHRPMFPQPSSKKNNTGGGSFNPLPPASAATVNTPDTSNIYPWQQSNTNYVTLDQVTAAQDNMDLKQKELDNMDSKQKELDNAKKILPISSKYNTEKNYTTHQVNFKNLYGENRITPVLVKTRGSHLNNDATVRMLAAMELQKQGKFEDYSKKSAEMSGGSYVHGSQLGSNEYGEKIISNAQKNHGNVFNHVYNTSTGNYVGFKDPTVSKSKNLTDSNNNPRLVKTKAPRLFGDRELPGIGRMSWTGFAGGKNDSGDPWKMTPRKEGFEKIKSFTVNNKKSPPMWVRGLIETPKTTRDSMISAKKDRLVRSEVFGSLDQYQEQESIDWSKGGNDYTNPGWTRQEEQMKIRQAENKAAREEKERIKKLKKGKTSKGSIDSVILSWNKGNSLLPY